MVQSAATRTRRPTLYVFSGLPGVGKSTLAAALACRVGAFYLRIDTVEQALRDLCAVDVTGEGYRLSYRVAADNLSLGLDVVADSCNPIMLTRREWRACAESVAARCVDIEVQCSDLEEHRQRAEARPVPIPGLRLPSWQEIQAREYEPWTSGRILLDTAATTPQESLEQLLRQLEILGEED